jgi:hypothetical protein
MKTSSPPRQQKDFQRHAEKVSALRLAVLRSTGATELAVRDAAFRGGQLPALLHEYVTKIRGTTSYRITDDDVKKLQAAGYSQDAIFEITIVAAFGAATERLEAGLDALKKVD